MKAHARVLAIGGFPILLLHLSLAQQVTWYQYVYPKPDSRYVSKETNIILRPGMELDPLSVSALLIRVEGSRSGLHRGTMVLSDDRRTVVFNLQESLAENERVSVDVAAGLRGMDGTVPSGVSFRFATAISPPSPTPMRNEAQLPAPEVAHIQSYYGMFPPTGDTLPVDFPPIKVDTSNNPSQGELFIGGFSGAGGNPAYANYLMILDSEGKPLAYKRIGTGTNPFEYMFKVEPSGVASYIDRAPGATNVRILDSTLAVIDAYPRGNPATISHADFMMLPNGHALALYFDIQTIDMSRIVKGGHPAASVWGNLVQEFDLNKNVVFQWSSFDYLPITDTYEDTLAASFDYSHANGIEPDTDGNFLLSNRHLSEITKIDRNTGEVLWRWGGKRNQFTFVHDRPENSPNYFSYPHSVRRLANGHIILFDNGNQHAVKYSRAVQYQLDEVAKTATLVWEYRHVPDIYSSAHGSVQRLPSGNTLIGWGDAGLQGKPALTEVRTDKSVAFELSFPAGYRSMRVYRLPWKIMSPVALWTRYELLPGNPYSFNDTALTSRTGVKIILKDLPGTFYNEVTVKRFAAAPVKPQFSGRSPSIAPALVTISQFGISSMNADIFFDAALFSGIPHPDRVVVFQRDTAGQGVFIPLQTSYNPARNEIAAVTAKFGEFVFCWSDDDTLASPPILVSPADRDSVNQRLPVPFAWNPKGTASGYQLQVALDSSFTTLALNDSLLTSARDTLKSVAGGTKYYWRVRTRDYAQISAWSAVRRFTAAAPYVAVLSPNDRDVLQRGKQYFIKWLSNIKERVRIDLFRGPTRQSIVKDSASNVGAFAWTIPSSLGLDTTYRIRITSVADSTVFSMSLGAFSVASGSTGVENRDQSPEGFALFQNYPNPFNPRTAVSFQLPAVSVVKLRIFDVLGREIETLVAGERAAGPHTVAWDASSRPSGVYIYRLEATDATGGSGLRHVETKKMVLVK